VSIVRLYQQAGVGWGSEAELALSSFKAETGTAVGVETSNDPRLAMRYKGQTLLDAVFGHYIERLCVVVVSHVQVEIF
jgi:hypothetical protein